MALVAAAAAVDTLAAPAVSALAAALAVPRILIAVVYSLYQLHH